MLLRWADVPATKHNGLYVTSEGCSHGTPTVKYRGIFLNDEQPALQNWAMEKFTNATGAALTGSPFNHFFYTKLSVSWGGAWIHLLNANVAGSS